MNNNFYNNSNNYNNNLNNSYYQRPSNQYPNQNFHNHMGHNFKRKKSKKPLFITISLVAVLLFSSLIWYFFFYKNINNYDLNEQVYLSINDKITEVYEGDDEVAKGFTTVYLEILNLLVAYDVDNPEYISIDEVMTNIDYDIIILMSSFQENGSEEIKDELNKYIHSSLETIKNYKHNLTRVESLVQDMDLETDVQKETFYHLGLAISSYKDYLNQYESYLKNPSNEKYEEARKTRYKSIVSINNSMVEFAN